MELGNSQTRTHRTLGVVASCDLGVSRPAGTGCTTCQADIHISSGPQANGVAITSRATVKAAERFLVANSGKPLDEIYSNFNRRLCRPFVRLLTIVE